MVAYRKSALFKTDWTLPFISRIGPYVFSETKEKINHLLFMDDLKLYSQSEKGLDSLVQTVHVFSEDIGMEFSIEKCATLRKERL